MKRTPALRIGTAGWSIPSGTAEAFPASGTHLARYAERLGAVEINSSFYRPHRRATYLRWAESVPEAFRFAVKLPKAVTHAQRLIDCESLLDPFLDEVGGLGAKLGVLLVQLPPSLAFDRTIVRAFFAALRARSPTPLACEPRHPTWFTDEANALLREVQVARVAADPPPVPDADRPGGWPGLAYLRLHGSPKTYYSDYDPERLAALKATLIRLEASGTPVWCIFDNTAGGHALGNALALAAL